jgi:hypothetical protein
MRRFQRHADPPPGDQTEQFEIPTEGEQSELTQAPVFGPLEPGQLEVDPAEYEPMEWHQHESPRPVGERFADFRHRVTRALQSFDRGRVQEHAEQDAAANLAPEPASEVVAEVPPRTTDARFPHAPLGYHRTAVDERIAELEAELDELRGEQPPSITEEIERLGDQTASILVVAHDQANETTRLAQEKADRCLADAAAKAEAMTEAAKQGLADIDNETDVIWRERARLVDDARSVGLALIALAEEAAERFPEEGKASEPPVAEQVTQFSD